MDYKRVEQDLQFLAKTDERYAELKAGVEHMKNMLKSVKGSYVTNSNESVSKASEAFYGSSGYKDVRDRMHNVHKEYFELEFIPRVGTGIGLTRLIKSMEKEGLI